MKTQRLVCLSAMGFFVANVVACSDSTASGAPGSSPDGGGGASPRGGASSGGALAGEGGASTGAGGSGTAAKGSGGAMPASGGRASGVGGLGTQGGAAGTPAAGGAAGEMDAGGPSAPGCDQIRALAEAYKADHAGNGGKDWDIVAKTPGEVAADPAAQRLLSICGKDERPVIPLLAWEYGGGDHSWINPDASAVAYCVSVPVHPDSAHWQYDASADHVTADVYVKCPDRNPCKAEKGANQVMSCLGDPTNIEILVDTASLNDGADAGLSLANASTDLNLVTPDGSKIHLYTGL